MKRRTASRGPGRPKLKKGQARSVKLMVRFTESEFTNLRRAAGDIAPSTYTRELVLRALKRRR